MKKRNINTLMMSALSLALATLFACDSGGGENIDDVDRKPLLTNVGSSLIVDSYAVLAAASTSMHNMAATFAQEPNVSNLGLLRTAWAEAYIYWQYCSPFGFGPADNIALNNAVNVFPTNTTKIETNIANGNVDIQALTNTDAKGFPALDYLLYGTGTTEAEVVDYFANTPNAAAYLTALTNDIEAKTNEVYDAWRSDSGNYLATFIAQDGTDQGSSLGQLVNKMSEDYEINKNFKLGLPAGIKTVGDDIFPDKAEGYYSGLSLDLMKANFRATEKIFTGNGLSSGMGLRNLLDSQGATQLSNDIIAQFNTLFIALDAIPEPFSGAISTNQAEVQTAYDAAQGMVVLFKTEMASALGVQISYQDGDND